MNKRLLSVFLGLLVASSSFAQTKLNEGFEESDTIPSGWGVWNNAPFPIDPETNWTVRDTGLALPGLATATSKAHSGIKAAGVSWWSSIDTTGGSSVQSDAWLVTRLVPNIEAGDTLKFWAAGGTISYSDSIQIWISDIDSTPSGLLNGFQIGSVYWPTGTPYGTFTKYSFDLTIAAGLDLWIGFRYFMDCTVNGFFVHLDDVTVGTPTASVQPVDAGIPDKFGLMQNYPNPFNPSTSIQFSLPQESFVTLKVYNQLGQEVASLVSEKLAPGVYNTAWDARGVASGVYFYRLATNGLVQTRKMVLAR